MSEMSWRTGTTTMTSGIRCGRPTGSHRGTGPGEARADVNGREVAYEVPLPAGEGLVFQLEPTRPGTWTGGMTQEEWQRQRGNVIRLGITPAHGEHGAWHGLLAKIKVVPGKARSTFLGHAGSRDVPPSGLVP